MNSDTWIDLSRAHDGGRISIRVCEITSFCEAVDQKGCLVFVRYSDEPWHVANTFDEIAKLLDEECER